MLDLGQPDLDWVGLARSMGVPGAKATTIEAFDDRFAQGDRHPGPFLVEVVL
jgi:acetolactate synthase-1/2/3 large subunit